MLRTWITDAMYAARRLRARPGFTLLSVLTLALGVGGTAAVFGIARPLIFDPLPYANADEVGTFWMTGSSGTQLAPPAAQALRHAPPLQVSPAPQAWPSQSVSRQSTKPSQSSSTPPEQVASLAAAGVQAGPAGFMPPLPGAPAAPGTPPVPEAGPPPAPPSWPTTLWVPQPPSSSAARAAEPNTFRKARETSDGENDLRELIVPWLSPSSERLRPW